MAHQLAQPLLFLQELARLAFAKGAPLEIAKAEHPKARRDRTAELDSAREAHLRGVEASEQGVKDRHKKKSDDCDRSHRKNLIPS